MRMESRLFKEVGRGWEGEQVPRTYCCRDIAAAEVGGSLTQRPIQAFSKDPDLLLEILNHPLLIPVHPPCNSDQKQGERIHGATLLLITQNGNLSHERQRQKLSRNSLTSHSSHFVPVLGHYGVEILYSMIGAVAEIAFVIEIVRVQATAGHVGVIVRQGAGLGPDGSPGRCWIS